MKKRLYREVRTMGWKEWRYELEKANREYDCGIVDREIYESRVSLLYI